MPWRAKAACLAALLGLWGAAFAQPGSDLAGKRIGVFFSNHDLSYDEAFQIDLAQFLSIDNDRSFSGRMGEEMLIRLGELYIPQLQTLSQADTVLFLNADMQRGKAFQEVWDRDNQRLRRSHPQLEDLDYVFVLASLGIRARQHRSVYIRSNRMITELIPVPATRLSLMRYVPGSPSQVAVQQVCYDKLQSPRPDAVFDFYAARSEMGRYLSWVFSQWWAQYSGGAASQCTE
ncbi:MAG: hypothetical protein OHK0039_33920 [Bacteroidia bacterium]